jgi:LAO/AO transport system kinase
VSVSRRPRLPLAEYERGVRAADRAVLAQAITLVESRQEDDAALAQQLLDRLLPFTGKSLRVGITGVPGAGKSTFIDEVGMRLVGEGKTVAVLAVDPSSSVTGGSILGDKTRMARLSLAPRAFIRPSPSGLSPGGIARRTRETLLVCEAAGFDVVLVETVGVGQGETAVAEMVDFFLVVLLAGAGDELQGIKKGILELADLVAVNKADGDGQARTTLAVGDLRSTFRYLPRKRPEWEPRALAISALTGLGLAELWSLVLEHRALLDRTGGLAQLRAEQQRTWMWSMIDERLAAMLRTNEKVKAELPAVEAAVRAGSMTPTRGADELLGHLGLVRRD